jgi:hypothetical protein
VGYAPVDTTQKADKKTSKPGELFFPNALDKAAALSVRKKKNVVESKKDLIINTCEQGGNAHEKSL